MKRWTDTWQWSWPDKPRRWCDLERLFDGLPVQFIERTVIFGAYDNLIARFGASGKVLRGILQFLEKTPLKGLGLSHFWAVEKGMSNPILGR